MFIRNEKRFNPYLTFTDEDGTTYANLSDASLRERYGVTETPDPQPPEDFSDDLYFRTESDDAPYVIYTRKSDEMIEATRLARLQAKREGMVVSYFQGCAALMLAGYLDDVEAYIAKEDTDPLEKLAWKAITELRRLSSLTIKVAGLLDPPISDTQMDDLFIFARTIQA